MKRRLAVRKSAFIALIAAFASLTQSAYAAPLSVTTPVAQTAVVGSTFSLQIVASGGNGGNQFSLASGALPTGLTLDVNSGVISGNPSTSESVTVTVRVTDNSASTATTSGFTINTGWMVSTYAGTGTGATSGNGGAATSAGMTPHSLSVISDGTVYFSDVSGGSIRKITTAGIVSAVSGSIGTMTGLWVNDSGDAYYGLWGGSARIQKYTVSNSTSTPWSSASTTFQYPRGMIADSAGNIYLADAGAHYIRKFAPDGTISTIAGTGTASSTGDGGAATSATINTPYDVAVDTAGNVYFTDTGGLRIRKISTSGTMSTILGNGVASYTGDGGLAINAQTALLWGIAVDGAGNIFFNERNNGSIRRIDAVTGIVTRVAGIGVAGASGSPVNGVSSQAVFSTILEQMRFDRSGNLYITDYYNNMIRKISNIGVPFTSGPQGANLSAAGAIYKGIAKAISADVPVAGKITFFANGKKISGCISKAVTVGIFSCLWTPPTSGAIKLSAVLTPSNSSYTNGTTELNVLVGRRKTIR